MAKRLTKRQKQDKLLRQHEATGQFKSTQVLKASTSGDTRHIWFRNNIERVQPSTSGIYKGVIDSQHARALEFGRQTASQFGWAEMSLQFDLVPSTEAVNPEDSRLAFAEIEVEYYEPTTRRMQALRHLKEIEKMDDEGEIISPDRFTAPVSGGNPLLSLPIGISESAALSLGGTDYVAPTQGSKILRYGFAGDGYPNVYHQSSLTLDANRDGDESDNYESQAYVLSHGDQDTFSVFERYEGAINPTDNDGSYLVQRSWAYPMSKFRVLGSTYRRGTVAHNMNPKLENTLGTNLPGSGLHTKSLTISGIKAVGGLVGVRVPEMFTAGVGEGGSANNDFDIICTLTQKWIPMA